MTTTYPTLNCNVQIHRLSDEDHYGSRTTDAAIIELFPTFEDDTDDRPDHVSAVIAIPWVRDNVYGELDDLVKFFDNLARRLRLARENYATGHQDLGEVR